jgi:hypothetical protein
VVTEATATLFGHSSIFGPEGALPLSSGSSSLFTTGSAWAGLGMQQAEEAIVCFRPPAQAHRHAWQAALGANTPLSIHSAFVTYLKHRAHCCICAGILTPPHQRPLCHECQELDSLV